MGRITKLKEAIKAGLAFAAVFGIAMQLGWMNPYWAGWAVAVIALPTAGDAIRKGTLRVVGTIPGCIAALVIQALAPQERWLFLFLTCAWVFVTSYLMVSRPKDSYVWTMACYVCLIILLSDVDSSERMFESAVFRTVETAMGVIVYTLISIFLWPQTNLGAIKQSSAALTSALWDVSRLGRDTLVGERKPEASFPELQGKVVQRLAQFARALTAEGSESYEVNEVRHSWERLQALSTDWLETAGRWRSGVAEFARIDLRAVLPGLPAYFAALDANFSALTEVLAGRSTEAPAPPGEARGRSGGAAAVVRLRSRRGGSRAHGDGAHRRIDSGLGRLRPRTGRRCRRAVRRRARSRSRGTRAVRRGCPCPTGITCGQPRSSAATTGRRLPRRILFDPPPFGLVPGVGDTIALLVAGAPHARASKFIAPVAVTSAICLADLRPRHAAAVQFRRASRLGDAIKEGWYYLFVIVILVVMLLHFKRESHAPFYALGASRHPPSVVPAIALETWQHGGADRFRRSYRRHAVVRHCPCRPVGHDRADPVQRSDPGKTWGRGRWSISWR